MRANATVPVFYYVLPGRDADGERAFGNTPRMIAAFEAADRNAVSVRALFADRSDAISSSAAWRTRRRRRRPIAPCMTNAPIWIFPATRSCRTNSRTNGSAICSPAAIGRMPGSTKASRRISNAFGAKSIWATMNTSTTCLDVSRDISKEDGERYRRPIVCNRFRDPIEVFDRHLYEKGRRDAAHAARRTRGCALLALDRALR